MAPRQLQACHRVMGPLLILFVLLSSLEHFLVPPIKNVSRFYMCICTWLLCLAMLANISLHSPTKVQPLCISRGDMALPEPLLKRRNMLRRFAFDTKPSQRQIAKIRGTSSPSVSVIHGSAVTRLPPPEMLFADSLTGSPTWLLAPGHHRPTALTGYTSLSPRPSSMLAWSSVFVAKQTCRDF